MTPVARLDETTRRFGATIALDRVSFEVREGETVALLGRNGAGKTTALALLLGLRRPDEGRAELFGRNPRDPAARQTVGVTPQNTGLPELLTVRETLDLVRAHFASPLPSAELLDRFGLAALARRKAGGLSGGEKRRLAVALAFAGRPRAVFLDEPSEGLDVEGRIALRVQLAEFVAEGGSVLLTTHRLEEVETSADRLVVIVRGRVVADGAPAAITCLAGADRLEDAFLTLTAEQG
jgi:ABC-2 type transport system ATP-binding protein